MGETIPELTQYPTQSPTQPPTQSPIKPPTQSPTQYPIPAPPNGLWRNCDIDMHCTFYHKQLRCVKPNVNSFLVDDHYFKNGVDDRIELNSKDTGVKWMTGLCIPKEDADGSKFCNREAGSHANCFTFPLDEGWLGPNGWRHHTTLKGCYHCNGGEVSALYSFSTTCVENKSTEYLNGNPHWRCKNWFGDDAGYCDDFWDMCLIYYGDY